MPVPEPAHLPQQDLHHVPAETLPLLPLAHPSAHRAALDGEPGDVEGFLRFGRPAEIAERLGEPLPDALISPEELELHVGQPAPAGPGIKARGHSGIRQFGVRNGEIREFEEDDAACYAVIVHAEQGAHVAHPVGLEAVAEAVEPVAEVAEGPYLAYAEPPQMGFRRFQERLARRPRPRPVVEEPDEADPVLQQFLDGMEPDAVVLLALAADGHVGESRDGAVVVFRHQEGLVRKVLVGFVPFFVPADPGLEFIRRDGVAIRHVRELIVVEVL